MPALAPFRQHANAHMTVAEGVSRAPSRIQQPSDEADVA